MLCFSFLTNINLGTGTYLDRDYFRHIILILCHFSVIYIRQIIQLTIEASLNTSRPMIVFFLGVVCDFFLAEDEGDVEEHSRAGDNGDSKLVCVFVF